MGIIKELVVGVVRSWFNKDDGSEAPLDCLAAFREERSTILESGGWGEAESGKRAKLQEVVYSSVKCASHDEKGEIIVELYKMGALGGEIGMMKPIIDLSGDGGVDLTNAILKEEKLPGISLAGANLRGADLRAIDLDGDDVDRIYPADFREVIGVGLKLQGADARGIHLEGANLRGAQLCRATLIEAKFDHNTDFSDARLKNAELSVGSLDENQLNTADFVTECNEAQE